MCLRVPHEHVSDTGAVQPSCDTGGCAQLLVFACQRGLQDVGMEAVRDDGCC